LVFVPGGGIGPLARSGRGFENQTVAVAGYRKLQHATQVDPLKMHRRNVAQLILSVPKLHSLTTISVLALSVDRIGIDQHTAEPYAGSYANRH
jgi:hypothetical protein